MSFLREEWPTHTRCVMTCPADKNTISFANHVYHTICLCIWLWRWPLSERFVRTFSRPDVRELKSVKYESILSITVVLINWSIVAGQTERTQPPQHSISIESDVSWSICASFFFRHLAFFVSLEWCTVDPLCFASKAICIYLQWKKSTEIEWAHSCHIDAFSQTSVMLYRFACLKCAPFTN